MENSILFRGVSVAKGAEVKDCILMQDTAVSRDAVLRHVIADKDVVVKEWMGRPAGNTSRRIEGSNSSRERS